MRLSQFPMVARHVAARDRLAQQLAGKLAIMIDGELLDADLVESVRPVLERQLKFRIDELDEDLRRFGVYPD